MENNKNWVESSHVGTSGKETLLRAIKNVHCDRLTPLDMINKKLICCRIPNESLKLAYKQKESSKVWSSTEYSTFEINGTKVHKVPRRKRTSRSQHILWNKTGVSCTAVWYPKMRMFSNEPQNPRLTVFCAQWGWRHAGAVPSLNRKQKRIEVTCVLVPRWRLLSLCSNRPMISLPLLLANIKPPQAPYSPT